MSLHQVGFLNDLDVLVRIQPQETGLLGRIGEIREAPNSHQGVKFLDDVGAYKAAVVKHSKFA